MLYAQRTGSGPRLALVHGFTQTRRSWGPVADDLARDHEVFLVDLPGHGRSWDVVAADCWDAAGLLVRTVPRAAHVGYSMGGRVCLHLALAYPKRVRAVVLIGATPGIVDAGERAARLADDDRQAKRIEREGVKRFVRRWLRQPMFAGLSKEAAGLEARLENAREPMALALQLLGTGSQEPLWDRLGELAVPTLVVAGERDDTYVGISRDMVDAMGPLAELAILPNAGHAAHLEQPEAFLAVVRPFLATHLDAVSADQT